MTLNELMRELYDKRIHEFARDFPVIVHLEDTSLILFDDKHRDSQPNRHRERYDRLKEISHLPLALFLAADDSERAAIWKALPTLDPLAADERVVAERIVTKCRAGEIAPLTEELEFYLTRAAELRIEGMHAQTMEWARTLGARWRDVRAVVATSHMARRESLPKTYFDWLLGNPERVFLAEAIETEDEALAIFGTHLVDTRISKTFFGDAKRMHRDLLSPPVERILAKMSRTPSS